jgi:predicted DNA-binding transcriptional regulator AlpA
MDGKKKITAAEARALTGSVYLDREAAAEYMGISARWLANNRHTGPRYLKVGNQVLYKLSEIESYMKQQEVPRRRFTF